MAIKEVDLGNVRGDINDSVATFTEATTRANIASGETGKTIFGKIKKWFADMTISAFSTVVNNATTTVANTVLDGRMGKILQDKIDELNRNIQTANDEIAKRSLANVESVSFGYDNKNAFTIDFNLSGGRVAKLVIENTGMRYLYSDGSTWTTIWSK